MLYLDYINKESLKKQIEDNFYKQCLKKPKCYENRSKQGK